MAQWGKLDRANNAPVWKSIATGSGTPNRGNTLFANVTSGAFINGVSIGVFGVSNNEATAIQPRAIAPGWVETTVGTGPVLSLSVSGGAGYVNGATIMVSNGTANGLAVITTNAAGNAASAVVTNGGYGFINTSVTVTSSNKWAVNIANATGGTTNPFLGATQLGFVQGNIITISGANAFVAAVANITSVNATGGNVQLQIVSRGAFANTIANQAFTYTITQGTGLTLGNTVTTMFGNTILANASALATISNVVLGGRSGRINRETLVYVRSMANNVTSGGGSTTP